MTPEETAALGGLLAEGSCMSDGEAAVVMCCPVCRGPVRAMPKAWYFRCAGGCAFTFKSTDIGMLQGAIRRRVAAALTAAVSPAEGVMADGAA